MELFIKLEMPESSKLVTGEVCALFGLKKSALNVVFASLYAQMILFQLIKKLLREKILIMIIAKDVAYVAKFAHSVQLK